MKRDTRIVQVVVGAVPVAILAASLFCSWAIAEGASTQWRVLFRIMCHGRPERCLEVFDVAMPICARCVGVYAGLFAGLAAFPAFRFLREQALRVMVAAALMPLALDGLTQLSGLRESTNPLRIATGVVAGFAFGLWTLSAVELTGDRVVTTS
jgi:uncharacterized membrane protein